MFLLNYDNNNKKKKKKIIIIIIISIDFDITLVY